MHTMVLYATGVWMHGLHSMENIVQRALQDVMHSFACGHLLCMVSLSHGEGLETIAMLLSLNILLSAIMFLYYFVPICIM